MFVRKSTSVWAKADAVIRQRKARCRMVEFVGTYAPRVHLQSKDSTQEIQGPRVPDFYFPVYIRRIANSIEKPGIIPSFEDCHPVAICDNKRSVQFKDSPEFLPGKVLAMS
jgi:hypothetical protein